MSRLGVQYLVNVGSFKYSGAVSYDVVYTGNTAAYSIKLYSHQECRKTSRPPTPLLRWVKP